MATAVTKDTAKLKSLPSPKPGDSFGNVAVRRKTVTSGHAKRESKGLKQFNVKVRARVRERFEAHFEALKDGKTKGELLEAMIDAYLRGNVQAAPSQTTSAPKADLSAGRTEAVPLYATPELAEALTRRAKNHGWTVSAVVENACAIAAEVEEQEG